MDEHLIIVLVGYRDQGTNFNEIETPSIVRNRLQRKAELPRF